MGISVSLNNVSDLTNTVTAQNTINTNSNTITSAFTSAVNVDGDTMQGSLDMNSNHILNLPAPSSADEPVRLGDIQSGTSVSVSLPHLTGVVRSTAGVGTVTTTFSGTGNLPVSQLAGGASATNNTFFRGDGTWASVGSVTLTAGNNITVSGTAPTIIAISTSATNYTLLQGAGGTGAQIFIGNTADQSIFTRGTGGFLVQNSTNISVFQMVPGLTGATSTFSVGAAGASGTPGKIVIQPGGTGNPISIAAASAGTNNYTFIFSTSIGVTNSMFMGGGTNNPHVYSTSVWPVDVVTGQVLVCNTNHTWSASQTVSNLNMTTPTITSATMAGTTVFQANLTFSTGTIGVVGCTDTSSGSAGNIGEFISTSISSASAVVMTTGVATTWALISLTPGDWDVTAAPTFVGTATTPVVYIINSVSTASSALDNSAGRYSAFPWATASVFNVMPNGMIGYPPVGPLRFSLVATATVFSVAQASFATGSCNVFGLLRARRVR